MATEADVAAGLFHWINSLQVADAVDSVQNLNDGNVIWKVLQLIDRLSFPGTLPEDPTRIESSNAASWIPRWNNLKHVYDALSIFLIEECEQRLPLFAASGTRRVNPDLKAIAQHASLSDTILILKLCAVAAANCADRIDFLKRMQELPEESQKVLMETLQDAQMANEQEEEDDEQADQDDLSRDLFAEGHASGPLEGADLAFEERLGKVIADNQRIAHEKRDLERQLDDIHARYGELQERHERSQDELTEVNARLSAVLSGRGESTQSKEAKNETIIAALEVRVAEADTELEELRKSNEVLKIKADRVQKLQDDYDEIKIEKDKLSRKANTAEKYRQKLEASQDLEKENANLKLKVSELQANVRQSDSHQASSSDLQREVDEYRRLLPSIEQERHELGEMKKRLEFDYHMLQARFPDSDDQLRRSRNEIEDLQGRLRDYEDGTSPTTPSKHDDQPEGKDLESEEADFAAAEARLTEALLKSSQGSGTNGEPHTNEDGVSEDELRAIMSAMRAQMQAGTAQERESGMKAQKKMIVMLEKARSKNQTLLDHVKKQSDLIKELQVKPSVPARPPSPPAVQPKKEAPTTPPRTRKPDSELELQIEEQEDLIQNLKREIRLITSAWYEQNQRMAALGAGGGGAVALMRSKQMSGGGIEEPKSFLGKQRRLLDNVTLWNGVKVGREITGS